MRIINTLLGHIRPHNGVKTRPLLQSSDTECGVAALAILLSYYGCHVSLACLREKCGSSRDGCKASTLVTVANEYGFDAQAYSVDWDTIANLREPVLAFWNFNHYVVIHGMGSMKVFINDPACGLRSVSIDEFDKAFTGVILIISPTDRVQHISRQSIVRRFIKASITGYANDVLFMTFCTLILGLIIFLSTMLSTVFIEQCLVARISTWVPAMLVMAIVLYASYLIATLAQKWGQFTFRVRLSINKTAAMTAHVLQLPLLFYTLRHKSDIVATLIRGEWITSILAKTIVTLVFLCFTLICCFIFLIYLDNTLSMITGMTSLAYCFASSIAAKVDFSYAQSCNQINGKLQAHYSSVRRNIDTIKACSLEKTLIDKWRSLFCEKMKLKNKSIMTHAMTQTLSKSYYTTSILLIICLGGFRVNSGMMSVGCLMSYYALHMIFYHIVCSLIQTINEWQKGIGSLHNMNDIMKYNKDTRFVLSESGDDHIGNNRSWSCNTLNFYYNKTGKPVIKCLNILINPGEHVAIVGATGSGKSTLAKLLCGLYPVHGGDVHVYGQNIAHLNSRELARYFSYVSQETSLFSGTIYENLTLWQAGLCESDILHAIHIACLDDLIAERGLHGKVVDSGHGFSGGEKQRIHIARALIQNTPIMILDEATSALDYRTEVRLNKGLRDSNKTILFVAHRLSTIQQCDQIIVLDQGVIVEQGRHAELMAARKHYYRLIECEQQCA